MRSIRRSQLIVDNYEVHVSGVAVLRLLVLGEGEIIYGFKVNGSWL